MSKVVGIIAEYNPFHNGHSYHIQNTKAQTGADFVVAVMTGNFTQRGNTSVINKWEKAKMALNGDADLVIELPTIYSVSSAENFANGAVKILNELGIVDTISFGMEADDISTLNNIANVLVNEPPEYKAILEHELSKGNSFPKARENALMMYLNDIKRYANVVKGSNNILAIEYLKALKKQKSSIVPFGVKREKVYYNSTKIIDEYASATGIRNLLLHNQLEEVRKVVPAKSYSILLNNLRQGTYVLDIIAYNDEIIYKLRSMTVKQIANLPDVSEGLEYLIKEVSNKTNNLIELINGIKSKRYTQTRIQRILLYALLGITKKDMEMSKKITPYIRVLGCSEKGKILLSQINSKAKVITSLKKYEVSNKNKRFCIGKQKALNRMLEIDKTATDIYTIGYKKDSKAGLDYTKGLILQ